MLEPAGPEHVASTWGSWLAGGVAVPLCLSHPPKCALSFLLDNGSRCSPACQWRLLAAPCSSLQHPCGILAPLPAVGGFTCYICIAATNHLPSHLP